MLNVGIIQNLLFYLLFLMNGCHLSLQNSVHAAGANLCRDSLQGVMFWECDSVKGFWVGFFS